MNFDLISVLKAQLLSLLEVVPNLIIALVVFLIGWIIARFVAKVLKKLLQSIGVDRLAERLNEVDIIYRSKIKIVPSVLISKLVYYILLFVFIIVATDVLGMAAVSEMMMNIMNYLPKLISALIVLLIGILVSDFLKKIVLTTATSLGIPAAKVIANIVFYFLLINVFMIALKQADLQTSFIENNISIILAGIVLAFAIGYGLASRSFVANLLSAFYNKSKIKIGDVVGVDGHKGKVIAIGNTSFTLQAPERKIVIPLSKLTSETIQIFED